MGPAAHHGQRSVGLLALACLWLLSALLVVRPVAAAPLVALTNATYHERLDATADAGGLALVLVAHAEDHHSAQLDPEFAAAAAAWTPSAASTLTACAFFRVEALGQERLLLDIGAEGQWPLLRLFRGGVVAREYFGAHTSDALLRWVMRHASPPLLELRSKEDLQTFGARAVATGRAAVVGRGDGSALQALRRVAAARKPEHDEHAFAAWLDPAAGRKGAGAAAEAARGQEREPAQGGRAGGAAPPPPPMLVVSSCDSDEIELCFLPSQERQRERDFGAALPQGMRRKVAATLALAREGGTEAGAGAAVPSCCISSLPLSDSAAAQPRKQTQKQKPGTDEEEEEEGGAEKDEAPRQLLSSRLRPRNPEWLSKWIAEHDVGLLDEGSERNYPRYLAKHRPVVFLYLPNAEGANATQLQRRRRGLSAAACAAHALGVSYKLGGLSGPRAQDSGTIIIPVLTCLRTPAVSSSSDPCCSSLPQLRRATPTSPSRCSASTRPRRRRARAWWRPSARGWTSWTTTATAAGSTAAG